MKNNKLPSIIVLMILSIITLLFWISFTIYRVFTSKPSPVVPEQISQSLSPILDIDTLNKIENRINP